MLTIVIVILLVLLIAGLPHWEHSRRFDLGYFPSGIVLAILVVLIILLSTGRMAWAQTRGEQVQTFTIDFAPFFTMVVWPTLSVILLALASVVALRIQKKWGIEVDKKTIETAVNSGLQLAQAKVASSDITRVSVQNEIIAQAANYAIAHVPGALKNLGVDITTEAGRASLMEKIEARLAPAVMVGEASPGPMTVAAAATIANPDVATVPAPVIDVTVKPASPEMVSITVNGDQRQVPKRVTYEDLVRLAGLTGNPSMTVSFGDRSRSGRAPYAGQTIDLDDGAHVTVVHTGNA